MNELITRTTQLPDTLEDLTQFVLVGKSKLNAYMLKLRTVNRLSVAQEIRNQTLEETQELANALIAAEQRIGELLLSIPKAQGFASTIRDNDVQNVKTKSETIKDMGYGEREAKDYQQMAKNPEIVRKVIEEATANGEVVTKSAVMKQIQRAKEEARQEAQAEINRLKTDNRTLANRAKREEPSDYKELKSKAKSYDAEIAKLNQKLNRVYEEKRQLADELEQTREQTAREQANSDFVAGAIYFIAQCGSFIRDVGGYVWIVDKLADLPERDREGYIKAAIAVRDWATVLLQNIERNEYGKQEIERIGFQSQ